MPFWTPSSIEHLSCFDPHLFGYGAGSTKSKVYFFPIDFRQTKCTAERLVEPAKNMQAEKMVEQVVGGRGL